MASKNQDVTDPSPLEVEQQSEETNTEKSNVRRRLNFGREVDNLKNLLIDKQEAVMKWNFDFENEVPLPGDWEWEKVKPEENIANSSRVFESINDKMKENRKV